MTDTLRVLTVRQPWAWAVLRLGKDVENRVRRWGYRGPVLIHSAKTCTRAKWEADRLAIEAIIGRCLTDDELSEAQDLSGQIVAVTKIVDCVGGIDDTPRGKEMVGLDECYPVSPWYADGQFGYILRNTQPLTPTKYKGGLGLRKARFNIDQALALDDTIADWFKAHDYRWVSAVDGMIGWEREARP